MRLAIIGPGRVGTTLALWFHQHGHRIVAVAGRRQQTAAKLAEQVGAKCCTPPEAAKRAELVLVTTQDAQISPVCQEIAVSGGFQPGQYVWHTSGTLPAATLAAAARAGAWVGALHPLQTFADPQAALPLLAQTLFTIEGDPESIAAARALLAPTGVHVQALSVAAKPAYHAAAVLVSNYVVTLVAVATQIWRQSGLDPELALPGLLPLLTGTVANLKHFGLPRALTGPIIRGDNQTVATHLTALAGEPQIQKLYLELGRRTLELAKTAGTLSANQVAALAQILGADTKGGKKLEH